MNSVLFRALILALATTVGTACYTRGNCPICRTFNRTLTDPSHAFTMSDNQGNTANWTCGYLEQSVALLDPTCGGLEAFQCAISQTWAERMCTCSGPSIPPLQDHVVNPTPSCNLCVTAGLTVPAVMENELVQTGVAGRMPCGGLYDALAQGILAANMCSVVQKNAAAFCCNVPILANNFTGSSTSGSSGSSSSNGSVSGQSGSSQSSSSSTSSSSGSSTSSGQCADLYESCTSRPCCSSYHMCSPKVYGGLPICQPSPSSSHQSLNTNSGGSAGSSSRNNNV